MKQKEKIKLQRYVSEIERITNETKELNERLTFNLSEKKEVTIKFHGKTGMPYVALRVWGSIYGSLDLELSEVRDLITWLKNFGIEG